jgi:hypothetical protein
MLDEAAAREHHLSAKIWAPAASFGVQTPLANALDVGCEFTLSVTSAGSGLLRVRHGWVELEKYGLQSLIPEGAQAELDSKSGPGTPQLADTSIYDRAIALLPPPDGLTRAAVRYKNQVLMDDWWHKLPYSRVKSWWLRWPDLLQDDPP